MNNQSKFDLLSAHVDKITPRKVVYIAQEGFSGYAYAAKGYIYELIKLNVPVKFVPYNTSQSQTVADTTAFSLLIDKKKSTIMTTPNEIVIHAIPEGWDSLLKNASINYTSDTKIIGRTVWEFDLLPETWVRQINNSIVNVVSVPTEWNKNTFIKCGVTKPIVVEPHIYINYPHQQQGLNSILTKCVLLNNTRPDTKFDNYYKFYNISQLTDRKNIELLVETFCSTFTIKDNVLLFLKTYRHNYSLSEQIESIKYIKSIIDKYETPPPIFFIKDFFTYDEITSLHTLCDCYVSLTKTEGFGLGAFNAFKSGKSVIITGYGGHLEYLPKNYSGLISYELVSVNQEIYDGCYLDDSYKWAIANKKDASELMYSACYSGTLVEKNHIIHFTENNNLKSLVTQHPDVTLLNLPYTQNNFYFNSALFKLNDRRYLMSRNCQFYNNVPYNTLKLFNVDEHLSEIPLKIYDEVKNEQYEDPRVLIHKDKIYVGCANYQLHISKKIHQKILVFDSAFRHIDNIHPMYDGNSSDCISNTKSQKNWTYFVYDDRILCVYQMSPHTVIEFDFSGKIVSEYKTHVDINSTWKFGEARMGSNPILKDGVYYNFFHSSIPWKNQKRQYLMGYYTFESTPPFRIVEISKTPILWGNETDHRFLPHFNPIVVFPCGAIYENDKFHVSFGINDEKTGIIQI